ncbi:MAG TPA: hypothetical protein DHW82_08430 [Spirochaetia bacterium]|nr:MAG: hypothetical protein A2Y41_13085 [Spirochaetes bacterium GWB1_36_13]HCL57017.1 hypothetical protein [Spirochaetia bacterium]
MKKRFLFILPAFNFLLLIFLFFIQNSSLFFPFFLFLLLANFVFFLLFFFQKKEESFFNVSEKKQDQSEKVIEKSFETDSCQVVENRYKNLFTLWEKLMATLEKMFHKSNEINLFSILQSDIIQNEFVQIDSLSKNIHQLKNHSEQIDKEIKTIADSSTEIKNHTLKSIEKSSMTHEVMQTIHESNLKLHQSISQFMTHIKSIEGLLSNIDHISKKTRTLSINASIEASKAGIHGSGFAVLAKEIRSLAETTGQYTGNIHELISSIRRNSEAVVSSMNFNSENIENGISFVKETSFAIEQLNRQMLSIDKMIQTIKLSLEEESENLTGMNQMSLLLTQTSEETKRKTESLQKISETLSLLAEDTVNQSMQIPSNTPVFKVINLSKLIKKEVEETIEGFLLAGLVNEKELFEPVFEEIPNTNPQKYHTKYQPVFAKNIQPILDKYKKDYIVNIALNDLKNYVPTCCKVFDQPETNDPVKNAKTNFTKRFFHLELTDKMNNAVNNREYYLYSYPLKEYQITLSDLGFPIYIRGKRWGTGRIGFFPERIK